MHSESYGETNGDQMAHYSYPTELSLPFNNNTSSHSHSNGNHHSPTNNNTTSNNNKNGKTAPVNRIGTRSRTGARVGNPNYALSSPEGKEVEREKEKEKEVTTTKGRGKRARVEKKEKEIVPTPSPEGEHVSLVCLFSSFSLLFSYLFYFSASLVSLFSFFCSF